MSSGLRQLIGKAAVKLHYTTKRKPPRRGHQREIAQERSPIVRRLDEEHIESATTETLAYLANVPKTPGSLRGKRFLVGVAAPAPYDDLRTLLPHRLHEVSPMTGYRPFDSRIGHEHQDLHGNTTTRTRGRIMRGPRVHAAIAQT